MKVEGSFSKNGFCVVRNSISKELCEFITQYSLFDEMQDPLTNDSQSPHNHSKHADPAFETLLLSLHSTIETAAELTLYPTYSYYRVYRQGSFLSPHRDRESCEISATICLNHSYSKKDYVWPIFIADHRIDLSPTDLAIYRGIELPHWRENFEGGMDDWHIQGFLHYVDTKGPYCDFKFDGRDSIGLKKIAGKKHYIDRYVR